MCMFSKAIKISFLKCLSFVLLFFGVVSLKKYQIFVFFLYFLIPSFKDIQWKEHCSVFFLFRFFSGPSMALIFLWRLSLKCHAIVIKKLVNCRRRSNKRNSSAAAVWWQNKCEKYWINCIQIFTDYNFVMLVCSCCCCLYSICLPPSFVGSFFFLCRFLFLFAVFVIWSLFRDIKINNCNLFLFLFLIHCYSCCCCRRFFLCVVCFCLFSADLI